MDSLKLMFFIIIFCGFAFIALTSYVFITFSKAPDPVEQRTLRLDPEAIKELFLGDDGKIR